MIRHEKLGEALIVLAGILFFIAMVAKATAQVPFTPPAPGQLVELPLKPPSETAVRVTAVAHFNALPQAALQKLTIQNHPTEANAWVVSWGAYDLQSDTGAGGVVRQGDYLRLLSDGDSVRIVAQADAPDRWE